MLGIVDVKIEMAHIKISTQLPFRKRKMGRLSCIIERLQHPKWEKQGSKLTMNSHSQPFRCIINPKFLSPHLKSFNKRRRG
jgi:hypothetical protein